MPALGFSYLPLCLGEADFTVSPEGSPGIYVASRIETFYSLGDVVPRNLLARLAKRFFGFRDDRGGFLPPLHSHLHDGGVAIRRQGESHYLHLAIEARAAEMPFSEKT